MAEDGTGGPGWPTWPRWHRDDSGGGPRVVTLWGHRALPPGPCHCEEPLAGEGPPRPPVTATVTVTARGAGGWHRRHQRCCDLGEGDCHLPAPVGTLRDPHPGDSHPLGTPGALVGTRDGATPPAVTPRVTCPLPWGGSDPSVPPGVTGWSQRPPGLSPTGGPVTNPPPRNMWGPRGGAQEGTAPALGTPVGATRGAHVGGTRV